MVKVFFIVLFPLFVFADAITQKVASLMDQQEFLQKKKLIEIIFKDQSEYLFSNGEVDTIKVIRKLKELGLLDLFLEKPSTMYVDFYTEGSPLLSVRTISESLKAIGYSYFITKKARFDKEGFYYQVYLTTRQAIDPISFLEQLQKRGIALLDINRVSPLEWRYDLTVKNARVVTHDIERDSNVQLTKPLSEYWINVENCKKVVIKADRLDRWYPKIFFLDTHLNAVSTLIEDERKNELKITVPHNSKYMVVTDKFTLANIKRGLNILLSSY